MAKKICPNDHGQKEGNFCDKCGAELIEVKVDTAQAFVISGENQCPGCQYRLKHEHQHYCPGCGHELKWLCR